MINCFTSDDLRPERPIKQEKYYCRNDWWWWGGALMDGLWQLYQLRTKTTKRRTFFSIPLGVNTFDAFEKKDELMHSH